MVLALFLVLLAWVAFSFASALAGFFVLLAHRPGALAPDAELPAIASRTAMLLPTYNEDPNAACALLIEALAQRAREFDVIHSHVDWLPLPVLCRTGVPFLTTMHGRLDLPGLSDVIGTFAGAPFVSISDNQRRPLAGANWIGTIQHGLPQDLFRPSYEAGSYLAFLGRLTAEKGPEAAMRIARAVRMPLRIAAKIPRAETAYFKKKLEPEIDGKRSSAALLNDA